MYGWGEDLDQICLGETSEGGYVNQALELHGCIFPGSPCSTQTMTDGNLPLPFLISGDMHFVLYFEGAIKVASKLHVTITG